MIKHFYIIIIFFTSIGFSQEYGVAGITNNLYRVDSNPTLIKSEFNNLTLTIKKEEENKEFLSPIYSDSFIYFRDDKIGIILTSSDIYKDPILLEQTKMISKDNDNKKLFFYSKNGDFVTVDYGKNRIIWERDKQKIKTTYVFENLSLGNDVELQECISIFGFDQLEVSDSSANSQNLIGLSEEEVIYRYSKFYEEPLLLDKKSLKNTNEKDLILLFKSKENEQLQSIVIFDEHKICKYIMNFYPNDYIDSVRDTYNNFFGNQETFKWTEIVGKKSYSYFLDVMSSEDQFIIHIKMDK